MSVGSRNTNARSTNARAHDERARRAVTKFRQMLPTLNAYLRAITGNYKLRIEISATSNGSSTKNTIYFQPPIQLGDNVTHDEALCDERDSDGIQACDACRIHEHLMAVMYHEIGHIAFGTHSTPELKHVQYIRNLAPQWVKVNRNVLPESREEEARNVYSRTYESVPAAQRSYAALAGSLHKYMGLLFNCTEDARVNEAVFKARRGVRYMYNALMAEVVRDGVPNPQDPAERVYWRDMALEFQMMLAVTSQLQGITKRYDDLFAEKIYKDLENEKLQDHLAPWSPEIDVMDNLKFTIELMKILNEMGYLIDETEPQDSSDDKKENDGSGDSSGQDGSSSGAMAAGSESAPDPGDESKDSAGEDREDDSDSSDGDDTNEDGKDSGSESPEESPGSDADRERPGGTPKEIKVCVGEQLEPGALGEPSSETDEATAARIIKAIENAIQKAIEQAAYFETASRHVRGVRFVPEGERHEWAGRYYDPEYSDSALNSATLQARVTFDENQRKRKMHNLKRGKISPSMLGKRAVLEDDRLFHKQVIPGKRDYHVTIGVDLSGSTAGRNLDLEVNAVAAQAELLHRVGIDFSIYGHSGDEDLMIWKVKEPGAPWDKKALERLMTVQSAYANLDGHALEWLRKRAEDARATERIILYYSDGKMPAENYDEELAILQREIRHCKRKGITLIGVGIRTNSPTQHGLDTVQVNTPNDLPLVLKHLQKYLLRKVG